MGLKSHVKRFWSKSTCKVLNCFYWPEKSRENGHYWLRVDSRLDSDRDLRMKCRSQQASSRKTRHRSTHDDVILDFKVWSQNQPVEFHCGCVHLAFSMTFVYHRSLELWRKWDSWFDVVGITDYWVTSLSDVSTDLLSENLHTLFDSTLLTEFCKSSNKALHLRSVFHMRASMSNTYFSSKVAWGNITAISEA